MKAQFADFTYWRRDILAGASVFLISLPLCLGIALASGAPLYAGLISGIVGGVIVGLISRSDLSVSGPAAGLSAFALVAVRDLGSYEAFLLVVAYAGLLQMLFAALRLGVVANYFPSNVVQGMLTGIGLIILLKQLPHWLGWDSDVEGDFAFFQTDGENTLSELLDLTDHVHPGAALIGITAWLAFELWEYAGNRAKGAIPGALVAILAGLAVNESLAVFGSPLALENTHLVTVPVAASPAEWLSFLDLPDWSRWSDSRVLMAALVLASMASVETLLNLEALEKIDPQRRYVSPNRDLFAQGVGNLLCGLCGGLPVTSVVVRSSANLEAGAASRLSTVVHGLLLLICVLTIPAWLNRIPLAAVAAVMLVIGYRLAHWELFRAMYAKGRDQFVPFLTTVLAVLLVDILHGVAIGMAVSVAFILQRNFRSPLAFFRNRHAADHAIKIELASEVSFLNKASVLVALENVPDGSKLIIDAGNTRYIDTDVLEVLREFIEVKAPAKGIRLTVLGFQDHYDIDNTETIYDVVLGEAMDALAEEEDLVYWQKTIQSRLTPHLALKMLKEGNFRFVNNLQMDRDLLKTINVTKEGQYPIAAILSCIDSRTSAELIFDQGLGDIFSIRIAGNILNDDILGSMEFACKVAGSKIIVVLGHSKCGAIKGACDHVQLGHLTGLVRKVSPAMERVTHIVQERNSKNAEFVEAVAARNVRWVMEQIYLRSPILAGMVNRDEIGIVGGMYEVDNGVVEFYEDPRFLGETAADRQMAAGMAAQ